MSDREQVGILVVEDHLLVRTGLKLTLGQCHRFRIVGEAADGLTAVEMAIKLRPHVILMDVGLPDINGVEATRQIKQADPSARVLMLTSHESDDDIIQAFCVGADGYCCKDISLDELTNAIDTVLSGSSWLDPKVKFSAFGQDAIEKSRANSSLHRRSEWLQRP